MRNLIQQGGLTVTAAGIGAAVGAAIAIAALVVMPMTPPPTPDCVFDPNFQMEVCRPGFGR